MNFAPRAEKPRLVTLVHDETVVLDFEGLFHYESAVSTVTRAACGVLAIRQVVSMRPVTCLRCLNIDTGTRL